MKWFEDNDNVCRLARYLYDEGDILDVMETIYFFEKPWKWEDKYYDMLQKEEDQSMDYFNDKYGVPK